MIKKFLLATFAMLAVSTSQAALEFDFGFTEANVDFFMRELNESVAEINKLKKPKKIEIDFESGGGSIFAGIKLLNRIDELRAEGFKFEGRVKRYCASMCFIVFQAMDNRIMLPYAIILDHPASGGQVGNLLEIEEPLKEMAYKRLKGNRSVYNRLVAEEYYMNAKNAIFWGLTDEVKPNFSKEKKDEKLAKSN